MKKPERAWSLKKKYFVAAKVIFKIAQEFSSINNSQEHCVDVNKTKPKRQVKFFPKV